MNTIMNVQIASFIIWIGLLPSRALESKGLQVNSELSFTAVFVYHAADFSSWVRGTSMLPAQVEHSSILFVTTNAISVNATMLMRALKIFIITKMAKQL